MQPIQSQQEEELERFRDQWRQEVQQKSSQPKASTIPVEIPVELPVKAAEEVEEVMTDLEEGVEDVSTEHKTAMNHYMHAIEYEKQGKLGKALEDYRRAFKLNPDIDFDYRKRFQSNTLPDLVNEDDIPKKEEYTQPVRSDPISSLIDQFLHEDTSYIPKLDYKPVPIAILPNEIILNVLKLLALYSVSTIPQFALVCKRFFLLTRDSSVWQYACINVFKEPSMAINASKQKQMDYVSRYDHSWMRMFIQRPRIRYDGVYISTCHYIRGGISDNSWNQVIHLVTYYRYIRFFPDGTILKHLTTDEPVKVVKRLQPGYDKQQCFHGHFLLEGDDNIVVVMRDGMIPRETFHMHLKIKATHKGRSNKLAWISYYSTCAEPGRDDSHYDLKPLKSFFFSPVRSYKVKYDCADEYLM